jgi:hypothetical protein
MIGVVAAWGIAGALAVSIGCSPNLIVGGQEVQHRDNDVSARRHEIAQILAPILVLLRNRFVLGLFGVSSSRKPWTNVVLRSFA